MKVLLGATAALLLMAAPALAQTSPALPAQCNFTAPPAIPDGATASNNEMRDARTALEAWRDTRRAELQACQPAVQALQAQANAAATVYNAAGHMAQLSVSFMPVFFSTSSNCQSARFSVWSGQAG